MAELAVARSVMPLLEGPSQVPLSILKTRHEMFVLNKLDLGVSLPWDTTRPLQFYWCCRALELCESLPEDCVDRFNAAVKAWEHPSGGYSSGNGMEPHMMVTFGVCQSACVLGRDTWASVNAEGVGRFISRCRHSSGGIRAYPDGEYDTRTTYAAVVCAALTGLLHSSEGTHPASVYMDSPNGQPTTPRPTSSSTCPTQEWEQTARFILSCQGPDGGFSAVPDSETHAAYTYCALAALAILGRLEDANLHKCARFIAHRQTEYGGFHGRPNKLVDTCYAFWMMGAASILHRVIVPSHAPVSFMTLRDTVHDAYGYDRTIVDRPALQNWLYRVAQVGAGGLRDKPGCSPDVYHTCYGLSGMCFSQGGDTAWGGKTLMSGVSLSDVLPVSDPRFNCGAGKPDAMAARFIAQRERERERETDVVMSQECSD
ncbi:protein farnesyltransferase subunit beta, partial [Kipferlia bialata]|eukprot:g3980.t1